MYIKSNPKKKRISFILFTKFYFYFSIILLFLVTILFFNTGPWISNKESLLNRLYFNGINNYIKIPQILSSAIKKFTFDYEKIEINIPYENLLIIEDNRKNLVNNSILDGSKRRQSDSFITTDAKLVSNNKNYKVSIRLKGDRTIHFRDKNKSSYKIKIKGDQRLDGMKKFSFIKPRLRNYIHEWLFHEFSAKENLIKLNYNFFYLFINGSNQGLYVLEENFGKELIERNKRRNGPIFTVLSEFDWNIYNSKLEVYNKDFWNKKENLEVIDFVKKKFNKFLKGDIHSEDIFDINKWAWFFAVTDLTYTFHGIDPNNVKMFYNPVSGLMEPIPYDGHRVAKNFNKHLLDFDDSINLDFANQCLEDYKICKNNYNANLWRYNFFYNKDRTINKKFYQVYIEALNKISNKDFLDKFFYDKNKTINKINSAIYSDYFFIDNLSYDKFGPGLYFFSKEDIYHRAKTIREKIKPLLNKIYITDNISSIIIENKSLLNHQLKINKIYCNNFNSEDTNYTATDINFSLGWKEKNEIKKKLTLLNTKCTGLELEDKNKKTYFKEITYSPKINYIENKNNNYLKYFKIVKKDLILVNNITYINENIFIPKNFIIRIKSNEKIILTNNSFIYSESPWMVGDANGKVEIRGEIDNFGGGIFILNASKKSVFNNTKFSYLSGLEKNNLFDENYDQKFIIETKYPNTEINNYIYEKTKIKRINYNFLDGKILYGSLNFYNTKAQINNSTFYRIDSEDVINFISSQYDVANVNFQEVSGDAIDVDFGKGKIANSNFNDIGNDGVDLSGTNSNLDNLKFNNVGDKLISVGELTNANVSNIEGMNAYVGVASKDGSKTMINNIFLKNVNIPFAAYIKKKSYEAGLLNISGENKIEDYSIMAIKDKNSEIIIDGKKNNNVNKEILNIIYKRNEIGNVKRL